MLKDVTETYPLPALRNVKRHLISNADRIVLADFLIRQIIRTAFRMNEQPSMKLMFKGYQGVFTDKLFCKLRRRRKWAKCCNFALLASFLPTYNLCPSWEQVRINFCSNWAEVGFGTSTQFGWRCISFYYQLGNNFAHILWALQIGKQWKPDPFPTFHDYHSGNLCKFSLLGEHPQSPLNDTYGVGCAFILNTFT